MAKPGAPQMDGLKTSGSQMWHGTRSAVSNSQATFTNQEVMFAGQKQRHRHREQTYGHQGRKGRVG